MSEPTVYLAGPTVFLPDPVATFDAMKLILSTHGLRGVAPLDNQIGLEGHRPGRDLASAIYAADENLMRTLDAAIFDVSPFRRGTEMDAGTAFEIGFCRALGKRMTGWTSDPRHYPELVASYFTAAFGAGLTAAPNNPQGATSGTLRDPDGILVHSAGLHQNLMIEMAIEAAGGRVHADSDWRTAFTAAAAELASLLRQQR